MARSHLCLTSECNLGVFAAHLGRQRAASVAGAHLWCMKTTETTATAVLDYDDNVVHSAFEASYSLKDLAAELQVSEQTICDLRSQGRTP